MIRTALPALVLLAAACTEEPSAPAQQGGEAAGEVLGGSISDDMIPLEQLASEAPLMPRQNAAPGAPPAGDEEAGDAPEDGAPASEGAEAAPAAPAPETPAEE
jgi:hypothetical protein